MANPNRVGRLGAVDPSGDAIRALLGAQQDAVARLNPKVAEGLARGVPVRSMVDDLSLDEKLATDPNILRAIGQNMQALNQAHPELAGRIAIGDPTAVREAYELIVASNGRIRVPKKAERQMDLPMGEEPRGLVPYRGERGFVLVPGSDALPSRGQLVPFAQRRIEDKRGGMIPSGREMSVPPGASQGWSQLAAQDRGIGAFDDGIIDAEFTVQPKLGGGGRAGIPGPPGRPNRNWIYPAMGAAAIGGAALAARNLGDGEIDVLGDEGASTADLADESRPAPSVETQESSMDYAAMARERIRQANEIQLREGRITQESAALAKEADALYQKAAEGRRTGGQPPIMPVDQQNRQTSAIRAQASAMADASRGGDYRSRARALMAELNMRSSEGTVSAAERQQIIAEINRLHALADQQQNARMAG